MLGMISMRARRKEGLRGALNRPLFRKRSWTLSSQQTPLLSELTSVRRQHNMTSFFCHTV